MLATLGSLFISAHVLIMASAHVALIEPPARNVMWRQGFPELPFHPDDDYLICFEFGNFECPPCGDQIDAPIPHPHEAGGKWATGIITRAYEAGQVIDVYVNLTRSHGGHIEFNLCPHNDVSTPVSQRCLDEYPLEVVGYRSGKVPVTAPYDGIEDFNIRVRLPRGLTCEQCVLQMTQVAEQFQPSHVVFRNCADISISGKSKVPSGRFGTQTRPSSSSASSSRFSNHRFG